MKQYKKPTVSALQMQPAAGLLALSGNDTVGNGTVLTRGEQGNPRKSIWNED